MSGLKQVGLALATACLLNSGAAHAALNDRGGGLLYDDVLKITWLQDANYAKTSNYDDDGLMNWSDAKTWASSLNISRVAGESLTGWRLAANTPVGSDWNYSDAYDGSTDVGYNITSPHSELSYMYYVNLKLKGEYSTAGAFQSDFGVFGNGTIDDYGQADVGPVKNLQSFLYWSGTAYEPYPFSSAWFFDAAIGAQYGLGAGSQFNAWAVLPGDVAALVPEPVTYAMLLTGLGLIGVLRRRKQKT